MGDIGGKGDELKGRMHKAYGELTDNPSEKQKGTVDKISGSMKQGVENTKEKVEDFLDRNKKQ